MRLIVLFFVSALFIFFSPVSIAQSNSAIYVQKNGKVPYDSMCFTIPATIKLKIDLEYCNKEAEIEFDNKYKIAIAEHNAKVAALEIQYDADKKKMEFIIEEQHKHIGFLNRKMEEINKPVSWYKSNTL